MKQIAAFTLAFAVAIVPLTGSAVEREAMPGDSMSGVMPGMMPGRSMSAPSEALGREHPLLSLALQNRAELGLAAEQVKALQGLVEQFGKEADQRTRDIENAERELASLLKQQRPDLAQADDKVRRIEKLRADLRVRRIQVITEGRAALTPEQQAKLEQLAAGQGRLARGNASRGAEEMQRFMNSERMPQSMSAMMAMAKRMGGGDTMLGMVRMMEMMSMMGGGMMGGEDDK